jgi:hypothetical protein
LFVRTCTLALLLFVLGGCGDQVSFEKVDYKGHVRVEQGNVGYCFKVPTDWEIRMKLEGADVVCLAPLQDGFRDSIVATSLSAADLEDPESAVARQVESLGESAHITEPWSGPDAPVKVVLDQTRFSKVPLAQLLYIHVRPDGSGVLIACTTTKAQVDDRQDFFHQIVEKAKYDLENCTGPSGLPEVFPTPEVIYRPPS